MIAYIRGELVEKEPTRVVVEAAGVGYEILIPLSTFDRLPRTANEVKLLAYHSIREDDETLFGFASAAEREFFIKLISVSGVGPRLALSILSGGSVGELALAVSSGSVKRLSSIKGVGKKTAEKICVELKDKVNAIEALASTQRGSSSRGEDAAAPVLRDAILALAALGFSEENASKMVSEVIAKHPDAADAETVIRFALSGGKK